MFTLIFGDIKPSLISLMVSVDLKHHVYLLFGDMIYEPFWPGGKELLRR